MSNASPDKIHAVLFDLDDTLHDDTLAFTQAARDVGDAISARVGVAGEDIAAAFVAELESFWQRFKITDLRPGENVRARMWAEALGRFSVQDELLAERCAADFEEARKRYYRLFPAAEQLLSDLRSRQIKLGLLTNGLRTTHLEKIALLQLERHVDAVFLSDVIGVAKPERRAFLHACDVLRAEPSRTMMVGDRYDKDVAGALEAGLQALWVNVRGEQPPQRETNVLTAATLDDAAQLLLQLTA